MAWWQLNAQFTDKLKGHWFWSSPEWMAIFGIPIGYLFFHSTRLSYEHFGFTWNIRMIGFGIGTLVFGLCSYLFLTRDSYIKNNHLSFVSIINYINTSN